MNTDLFLWDTILRRNFFNKNGNWGEFVDKKKQEELNQKKFDEKFNSITQKAKPVNQNQDHNVKSEGVETKIRQL